ncbi:efflux RND transporter periplasmic adaptor subunit [Occallatibacter riparius]|uniref:Efflux RND transporter periplasmic adaptor subunit n=1 Tax=Occallatibacter riparius TaxID=1002689 RepID=A0A9J7BS46_9BACT|nr:efflux RND transporter periplasmic adaptor subunit [Occallatibacter riparius]UWZ85401.1 efflux RND transporter periplasmic adaptor subunit [Occallatibacter riparius]
MRKLCLAAMSAVVVMWSMAACKHDVAAGSRGAAPPDPLTVHLTPELRNEIKTGSAQWQEVTTQQKVAARVETDASRVARVGSPVNGRITKMLVFEGQHVKQGQVLAMLHSNALSDAQFAFIRAYTQENLARQSAERAKQLVQSDVIGTAELEKRQAELLQTSAEVAALGAQLRGLGMTDAAISRLETSRQINSEYPITASISGTLIERKVTIGQVVQPADEVFLIADLSNVWLVAEVPEEHSASLYPGKTVLATVPALPHEPVTGTLNFVSPVVNPETRTVQARMDLPNAKELFKPQMLASMTFESRPQRGLTIPSTAVVREDNKDQVFVKAGADSWRLREVELGPEVADHRLVLKGITENDEIVLNGAFHLNNQRKQDMIKGAE